MGRLKGQLMAHFLEQVLLGVAWRGAARAVGRRTMRSNHLTALTSNILTNLANSDKFNKRTKSKTFSQLTFNASDLQSGVSESKKFSRSTSHMGWSFCLWCMVYIQIKTIV